MKTPRLMLAASVAALCMPMCVRAAELTTGGKAEQTLSQAAQQRKYTFLMFYKDDNVAAQAMAKTLKEGAAKRSAQATYGLVQVTDPAEKGAIDRFGISRTPLPLTIIVAPNGAMTGIFSQKVMDKQLEDSFVTPVMAGCMKSLQEGKLVIVCVHRSPNTPMPAAVQDFQVDPQFSSRLAVASLQATDPAETSFLKEMTLDSAKMTGTVMVFLAPPGVQIGKFEAAATKDQMAAALHQAGKCCDDPNCKHNQANATGGNSSTKGN